MPVRDHKEFIEECLIELKDLSQDSIYCDLQSNEFLDYSFFIRLERYKEHQDEIIDILEEINDRVNEQGIKVKYAECKETDFNRGAFTLIEIITLIFYTDSNEGPKSRFIETKKFDKIIQDGHIRKANEFGYEWVEPDEDYDGDDDGDDDEYEEE